MKFSDRTNWPAGENRLAREAAAMRRVDGFIDLTETNPTRCGFRYLDAGLLTSFSDPQNLRYEPDPRGLLEAREAIASFYASRGVNVSPEAIFLTAGTSEAYGFLFGLLADPGEAVLAPRPGYPLFEYLADLHGLQLKKYALHYERRWGLDAEAIEIQASEDTRAVIAIHPNNPTGSFLSTEERRSLMRVAEARKMAVISDEVFLDFGLSGKKGITFAGETDVPTFVLGGVSKLLGLPQMKLSWIVVSGPDPSRRHAIERLEIIADTYLTVNTPSQHALPHWLKHREAITAEISDRVSKNYASLKKVFSSHARAEVLSTEAGWAAVLKVDSPEQNDEEIAMRLLKEARVMTHPGYFFDFDGGSFLVLSLLPAPGVFSEGISRSAEKLSML